MTALSSSGSSTSSSDTGRGRMLMLLSLMMEDCSEAESSSELSSYYPSSSQMQNVEGDNRSFSASPPLSSRCNQGESDQPHKVVTPPASRRMVLAKPKSQCYGGHSRATSTTTGHGLKSLLMASARPLEGYQDLEQHFSTGTSSHNTGGKLHSLWRDSDSNHHTAADLSSATERILNADSMAVRRRYQLPRLTVNPKSFYRHEREVNEPYDLPLNLAILYHGEESKSPSNNSVNTTRREALKLLTKAGPDVLTLADGPDQGGSLGIALRHHPHNLELAKLLLEANPNCAMVTDQRKNLPLHVACLRGAALPVVRKVFFAHPRALYELNWNGDTPYHIVLRNPSLSSSAVSDFFYTVTARLERGRKRQPAKASPSTTRW